MAAHSIKHAANIDRLRIATPCPISWEQMTGNSRVRFCGNCQLNVYNISELSCSEAEALIASTEGRLCARLFRRADGTILTKDCPVGLRALRMRVSKKAAAVFATIAGISSMAFGQQSAAKDVKTACTPQTRVTRTNANSDPASKVLSGTVVDQAGAVIPGARVTVTNVETKETRKTSTNVAGRFEFASLAAGNYSITIEAEAFKTYRVLNVDVEKDRLIDLNMILELHGEALIGVVALPDLFDTTPGTTIMSGDLIRKLPIQ
jgi:hypothetical protein